MLKMQPPHGWNAVAWELAIVTVGVLVALAAQQIVENIQSAARLRHAEAAMRLELAENDGPQAYARALIAKCLDQEITRINVQAATASPDHLRSLAANYIPPFRTWDSEAWHVVVASDIGGYMGPDRLVAWSTPYRMMPHLSEANEREAELVIDLRSAVPPSSALSATDVQSLRRAAARLRFWNRRFAVGSELLLKRIGALDAQVPERIQRDLIATARATYGGCVTIPDLGKTPRAENLISNLRSAVLDFR